MPEAETYMLQRMLTSDRELEYKARQRQSRAFSMPELFLYTACPASCLPSSLPHAPHVQKCLSKSLFLFPLLFPFFPKIYKSQLPVNQRISSSQVCVGAGEGDGLNAKKGHKAYNEVCVSVLPSFHVCFKSTTEEAEMPRQA